MLQAEWLMGDGWTSFCSTRVTCFYNWSPSLMLSEGTCIQRSFSLYFSLNLAIPAYGQAVLDGNHQGCTHLTLQRNEPHACWTCVVGLS